MLMRNRFLIGKFSLFLIFCFSFCGTKEDALYQPMKRNYGNYGIYPKIFRCVGKEEMLCLYFTGRDGKIWFFPVQNFENPVSTIAYTPREENSLAFPLLFSPQITAVFEVDFESYSNLLFVRGLTELQLNVSFASAKIVGDTYSLIFGDSSRRNLLFSTNENFFYGVIKNDRNIIFDRDENRETEISGNWGRCADVMPVSDEVVHGVVFSKIFSALNYFVISGRSSLSEFIGWEISEEKSTLEPTGIPSLYSARIKGNAYPSVDSTRVDPNTVFGFSDINNLLLIFPSSPPREVRIRYLNMTKKYMGQCSICSDGRKSYIFGSDGRNLLMFLRRESYIWDVEKVADFTTGQIVYSLIYNGSPCVMFNNLNEMALKVACKIKGRWDVKEIDYGIISDVSFLETQNKILVVYNIFENRELFIRYTELDLGKLFRW